MPESLHCRRITLPRRGVATLLGWACGLALVAGCQSGAERDIVQRELRQQEDQIYQLQDCLNDYQQIICQYRRENESLKQQAVQGQFRDGKPSTTTKPGKGESSRLKDTPIPPSAPRNGSPREDSELVPPGVPPLELNQPSPLPGKSTSNEDTHEATLAEEQPSASSEVLQASYETPIPEHPMGEVETLDAPTDVIARQSVAEFGEPSIQSTQEAPTPPTVVSAAIRGQVMLDKSSGGPRVLVEVAPLDAAGDRTDFSGSLSLMVLDHAPDGKRKDVARWDFPADELARCAKPHKVGTSWAFPLQLPAEVPADRPIELWVRLIPDNGKKVLCRTAVNVGREGRFASARPEPQIDSTAAEPQTPPSVEVAVTDPKTTPVDVPPAPIVHRDEQVLQSGWTIARPGIATEAMPTSVQLAVGNWRTATQPVPVVESQAVARRDTPPMDRYADRRAERRMDVKRSTSPSTPLVNDWAPVRAADSPTGDEDGVVESSSAPLKPTWSASR